MGFCDGRVVIVTGAGRGLGRGHALAYAAEGAHVLVNDLGVHSDGSEPRADDAASAVVDEILAAGGSAAANHADVAGLGAGGVPWWRRPSTCGDASTPWCATPGSCATACW